VTVYGAREIAERVIEKDPTLELPEHQVLKQQLSRLGSNRYDWSRIS
jgi:ATP-dependent DNA helicase RecG